MTSEAIDSLTSLFRSIWNLLGSITIPGTFLTGQHLLLAPLGAVVFITAFKKILDIGAASGSHSVSLGFRNEFKRNNKGQED